MKAQDILIKVKDLVANMNQQEQADFIWSLICETNLKDATMNRVDGGYEIILEMDEEDEDEHEDNGSEDYLCDNCDKPVNKEDWCFNCKDYVYIHQNILA